MPAAPAYFAEGPEALVVSLAGHGDREAFAELVRRRQPRIRAMMRRFGGDDALADDLARQVFIEAWRKIGRLRHPEQFGSWIGRMAVDAFVDAEQKHRAGGGRATEDNAGIAPGAAAAVPPDPDTDGTDQPLVDPAFTAAVMREIRARRRRVLGARLGIAALLVLLEFMLDSPLRSSLGVAGEALGTSLFPAGDGWLAFLLAPLNSVAGLVGLLLLGLHGFYRRFAR